MAEPAARSRPADASSTVPDTQPARATRLRQLMVLRTIALCGQTLAIVTASALGVALPLTAMISVIVSLVAWNAITWIRLRRSAPVGRHEIALHVAYDLGAFTLLLYLSGGSGNPFSLVYVLHVVVMALVLPPLTATLGTILVVASFSVVAEFSLPLRLFSGEPPSPAVLAFGYWLSVTITAVVVAWFVVRIVASLREHERLLRESAQQALADEAILRVGALAAGAAHELTTPLTTIGAVIGEMEREASTPSLRRDVGIVAAQIETCRQTLSNLLAAAGHARAEGGGRERLDAFVNGIAARFRTMRPEVTFTSRWEGARPIPQIFAEQALKQSVLALLNNAADASPDDVVLTARWDDEALRLTIEDRGSGVPPALFEKLGRVFFTTKPPGKGTGLGLVIAVNGVKQLGGSLRLENRASGGTLAAIVIPLRALILPEVNR